MVGVEGYIETWWFQNKAVFLYQNTIHMAYVYKHTRLDKNEVFYIGIGSDSEFKRAYDTKGRNEYWHNIISLTSYNVEIIINNVTQEEACTIEIELISQYKRRKDGGTLSNLTEGGEGFRSNHTEETKQSISKTLSGKTYEELHGKEKAEELKNHRKEYAKQQWKLRTQEEKKVILNKIVISQKGKKKVFKSVICPHCNKSGGSNVMHRFHFDNCILVTGKERKLSDSHKKKFLGRGAKKVQCVETGIIYNSVGAASKSQGGGLNVSNVLDREATAGGFHWKRVVE